VSWLVGVDGCRGGWIAAVRAGEAFSCVRVERLERLFARSPAPEVVAVDAPIGLVERGARECDRAARALLGSRRSSVFPAPLRPLLAAASYPEASRLQRALEGKGLSRQSWAIVPKIAELDVLLRGSADARAAVREVHPELSFLKLNRDRALEANKRRPEGRAQRHALLRTWCGDAIDRALAARRALGCTADDVLDAFAALWTAERIARGVALSFPADPPRDARGLPMAITA
jgi:predicted RNase H-like nuclease